MRRGIWDRLCEDDGSTLQSLRKLILVTSTSRITTVMAIDKYFYFQSMTMVRAQGQYTPGLHMICDMESSDAAAMQDAASFMKVLHGLIAGCGLSALGEVVHSFPGAGFTAVVCLTESHISIHTWPEYGRATFDVFLSNYMQVNDGHAQHITAQILEYFSATAQAITEIKR